MEEEIERPGLFKMWPYLESVRCPNCDISWQAPQFASAEVYFPSGPKISKFEQRAGVTRPHCPHCGVLLPELQELIESEHAWISPLEKMEFAGTISGVRQFLAGARGKSIRLWKYRASHSMLALMIKSATNAMEAYIVCPMTSLIQLPRVYWKCNFTLEPTNDPDEWALVDEVTPARIECSMVGIFYVEHSHVSS